MTITLLVGTMQTLLTGLAGAVLGGTVTLAGLLISLRHQDRVRREDRVTEYLMAGHVAASRLYARVISPKPDPAAITTGIEELVGYLTGLDIYARDFDPETMETRELLIEDILGILQVWRKHIKSSGNAVLMLFEESVRHVRVFYGHLLSGRRHLVPDDLLNALDEPDDVS